MSIITCLKVSYKIANHVLLDEADWAIEAGSRVALVGRNGAGKSSLLKLLTGELVADKGEIRFNQGVSIAGLTQEVPFAKDESVYHFMVSHLGETGEVLTEFYKLQHSDDLDAHSICQQKIDALNAWDYLHKVDNMAMRLGIPLDGLMKDLSGGLKRRVLLAASLLKSPTLLLLDEPTNHLDVGAIEWLESYLKSYEGAVLLVTHDRTFLETVVNEIVEIDRGKLYRYQCNYETFLNRREERREAELKHNALFDKNLSEEETWIRTGVKARRTRNEGRVRALKALREAYKNRRNVQGSVKDIALESSRSGQVVFDAKNMGFQYDDKILIKPLSLLLMRGDKLGIVGPNGCGKTTLVRLLLGELMPTTGSIKRGTALEVAYFDQLRSHLDESQSVMFNVADGSDYVTLNGQKKHVASYLRDFLFTPEKFQQKVSTLSGGEKNRLMLAKLLAKPVNCLVMDEPTNDLDIETLELLETVLVNYQGTLILISHDRSFINEVVTSILAYEGNGVFNEYVGGYDDYKTVIKEKVKLQSTLKKVEPEVKKAPTVKLSYPETRELEKLPKDIEVLEGNIASAHNLMGQSDFYSKSTEDRVQFMKKLGEDEAQLAKLYARWEQLEAKR